MEKEVYKGQFIRVTEELIDGIIWERAYLPDGVIIFPFTNDGKIILVRELRPHESPNVRLKPVSGMIEKEKGTPEENAQRELQEEIGFMAQNIELFFTLKGTGTTNNSQYFYVARNLVPSKLPNPDGEETIMGIEEFTPQELLEKYMKDEIRWTPSTLGFFRLLEYLKSHNTTS